MAESELFSHLFVEVLDCTNVSRKYVLHNRFESMELRTAYWKMSFRNNFGWYYTLKINPKGAEHFLTTDRDEFLKVDIL